MIEFYIDSEAELWDYDYKEEVAGEEFDELFVVTGNRDYIGTTEASWWKYANNVMDDISTDSYPGSSLRYYGDIPREQRKALVKLYEDCRYVDDIDTMVKALNILYPEREFTSRTIRGYCQRDWQEIVYDKKAVSEETVKRLEAWYFGAITELHCINKEQDDDCWSTITDDELWEWEREDKVKENLLNHFGYDKSEECEVYVSNGYTQVKNWKAI